MTPRVRADPYYGPLAARFGPAAVMEAGWFDDGQEEGPLALEGADIARWLCTALPNPEGGDTTPTRPREVVLLATGAMCPAHQGHVAMMESARAALEATGRRVLAGFLSPGHDDYIRLKWGERAIPASERLTRCADLLAHHAWLAVDPWEALHTRTGVNFTDVVARLQRVIDGAAAGAGRATPPRVMYVCGGDNARFALAFAASGGCVVVGRPGAEREFQRYLCDPRLTDADVLFVPGADPTSSTALRRAAPAIPEAGAARTLCLRVEDGVAVRTLGLPGLRWEGFVTALLDELRRRVLTRVVPLEVQRAGLGRVGRSEGQHGVVSLDPMLPFGVPLAVSRCFALGGYRMLGHVARPGAAPLAAQLARLPEGPLVVLDDDAVTGSTLRAVQALLPGRALSLQPLTRAAPGEDIADARDFLPGTDDGGLVVALPDGAHARAPYLLPYVDPSVRCSLPAVEAVAFSAAVWTHAAEAFAGTGLRVADLPGPAATLYAAAGFGPAEPLDALCAWHAEGLRRRTGVGAPPATSAAAPAGGARR